MKQPIRAVYLYDPLCGWCYGASSAMHRLAGHPRFAVELAPTGLFSGSGARPMDDNFAAYAWANDQRIAKLTGQPFSETYRHNVLGDRTHRLDSGPATLALTAIACTDPARELEGLSAIQTARFVNGRDITDTAVLIDILRGIDLNATADAIVAMDEHLVMTNERRVQAAHTDMRRYGVEGVPTVIVGDGDNRYPVRTAALLDVEALIANLQVARGIINDSSPFGHAARLASLPSR